MSNFFQYDTYFFDCDGVILDSNEIKSQCFYEIAKAYNERKAEEFLIYHKENGGISRFEKFNYFFKELLQKKDCEELIKSSIEKFSKLSVQKLMSCPYIKGFENFIFEIANKEKYVVSGGLEDDLIKVFQNRKIAPYFKGIYGSPKSKLQNMKHILNNYKIGRSVFIGDSLLDFQTAKNFNCDFIFLYEKTELHDWRKKLPVDEIYVFKNFSEIS